jgi:hypothetical protein
MAGLLSFDFVLAPKVETAAAIILPANLRLDLWLREPTDHAEGMNQCQEVPG